MECADEPDYYFEGPYMVFTAVHHLRRGSCCGSRCRHCPYEPKFIEGATTVASEQPCR